jgi:hypothetical protein
VHREDRGIDRETNLGQRFERPEIVLPDREILRAKGVDRRPSRILNRLPGAVDLVSKLPAVHRGQRPVTVSMRLNLVAESPDLLHQSRKPFRNASLYEKSALHCMSVEHLKDAVHIPDNLLSDRSVGIDTRLIPILNVDGESRFVLALRPHRGWFDPRDP